MNQFAFIPDPPVIRTLQLQDNSGQAGRRDSTALSNLDVPVVNWRTETKELPEDYFVCNFLLEMDTKCAIVARVSRISETSFSQGVMNDAIKSNTTSL